MPSARKRVLAGATGATGWVSESAAMTGDSAGLSANAAMAENDRARTQEVRVTG